MKMNDIRKDAKERIEFVFNDEGLDLPDEEVMERIVHEAARVALLEMKHQILAFFPILTNLKATLEAIDPNVVTAQQQLKLATEFIQRWDSQIAAQA